MCVCLAAPYCVGAELASEHRRPGTALGGQLKVREENVRPRASEEEEEEEEEEGREGGASRYTALLQPTAEPLKVC